ncbi:alpha/beta fold hydrolase [Roseomonas genomospecies 6]|uniref:Alpha/beta hydrolase n=1 Tax=Roseomonas genomospecies 6 TaxID=214106 RepID=A0A9W7KQX3_9PROT|nr:alpha/beta fold hydrolase [Roseomonas genomospecies 6]KAA0677373.1 alpha/beta hydrolase [Roseomonas genomospecies 6]
MTGPLFVLVHGWGFGPGVWDGVRASLPEAESVAVDLGFYGPLIPLPPRERVPAERAGEGLARIKAPILGGTLTLPPPGGGPLPLPGRERGTQTPWPRSRPIVAVGHSFGALWLLHERPFAWDGLVLVNGFPRFTEGDAFAPATPRRVLDRMIARFDAAPEAVAADFLRRCGCEAPPPEGLQPARLGEALRALRDWDARAALTGPALALAGAQDPIVPPAMTEQAFRGIDTVWHPDGGHLLPLTAPDWCAERIAAFAAGLSR